MTCESCVMFGGMRTDMLSIQLVSQNTDEFPSNINSHVQGGHERQIERFRLDVNGHTVDEEVTHG